MPVAVCAVRDGAMQAFAQPMFVPAPGVAVRSFSAEVNRKDPQNMLSLHPSDFELHYIADFHEETASFVLPPGGPRLLARAVDLVQA